ncbi:MAG: hypothetical protein FJ109_03010 [Deltaproteobacteria bacterium]|nr:hypothetical protein [Deltaproteobacteria bacterium]
MTGRFFQYLNDIERFFCVVRTSGFVLSPRDCERVRGWYLKGVPMQVVLAGLVLGLRSFKFHAARGQRPPHQLSFYSHFIGASVRRFRSSPAVIPPSAGTGASSASAAGSGSAGDSVGATGSAVLPAPDPSAVQWVRQLSTELELAREREERPEATEALDRAAARLRELAEQVAGGLSPDALSYDLQVLDEATLAFYHTRLDEPRRQALEREAAARLSRETGLSSKARAGRMKAILAELLRADLHLMELAP